MNSVNISITGSSKFISVAVPDGSIKLFGEQRKNGLRLKKSNFWNKLTFLTPKTAGC